MLVLYQFRVQIHVFFVSPVERRFDLGNVVVSSPFYRSTF
jgi:hypothetical protein